MKRIFVVLIMSTLLLVLLVERFPQIATMRSIVYSVATLILVLIGGYSFYLQLKKK